MPKIELITPINAPLDICFDLSRSIDLHKRSAKNTQEEAIDGITTGLIGLNQTVTWKAKHFGVWFTLTSKVTEFKHPKLFVDEMLRGPFKSFKHEHLFHTLGNITIMSDRFYFQSPLGLLGRVANLLVLARYMKKFLERRSRLIKEVAESDNWKEILSKS